MRSYIETPMTLPSLINEFFNDINIEKKTPLYDVINHDDRYELNFSLPGIDKENINIDVDNNELIINAKTTKDKSINYVHESIFKGDYYIQLKIPNDCETDDIDAKMNNGILTLIINKKAKNKTRTNRIMIK